MFSTPATERRVSDLCDQFAAELQRNSRLTVEEFVAEHRSCAELLLPALTAMQAMLALGNSLETQPRLPRPGDVLGDFKIVRLLSHGGMGLIYVAEQTSLARLVALKVLAQFERRAQDDSSMLVRFHNEMVAVASLQHPHIVPVYGVGSCGPWHFFAMQLIDGMSWQAWNTQMSKAAARDWRDIARAIRDVAHGLQHAHERGVLHRDIKPSNLLRDVRGEVWIVDFGLASYPTAATVTATGDLVGTLRYMSPEQLKSGMSRNDPRSDIYSLGATFYEMLTSRPVIDGANKSAQLCALVNQDYPPPRQITRDLPVPLETIVLKMIARDPQDRYQTADEVARDIDRWLQDIPIQAKRLSVLQHSIRWSRAHAGLMLTLIVGMTLAMMLLVFLTTQLLSTRNDLRQQLMISHATEAHARTTSRLPGQRFEALASVAEAIQASATNSLPESMRQELGRTAATALSLIDAQPQWQIPRSSGGSLDSVVFSRDHRFCTRAEGYNIEVIRVSDGKTLSELSFNSEPMTVCFCDQGLVVLRGPESQPTLELWSWIDKTCRWSLPSSQFVAVPRRFAIDVYPSMGAGLLVDRSQTLEPPTELAENFVAMGLENGDVVLLNSQSGAVIFSLQSAQPHAVGQVHFSPDGKLLAATNMAPGNTISVWNLTSRELEAQWNMPQDVFTASWSPDGSRLAVGSGFDVYVYDARHWYQAPLAYLSGPQEVIANIYFHPSNRWLAVYGYDGKSRLWDIESQLLRLTLDGHAQYFHPTDNALAFRTYDSLGIWRVGLDEIVWHQQGQSVLDRRLEVCQFVSDRWLAVAGSDGILIFDSQTHDLLLDLDQWFISDLRWVPESEQLFVASPQGLWSVALANIEKAIEANANINQAQSSSLSDFQTVLQPDRLTLPVNQQPLALDVSGDGRVLLVATISGGLLCSRTVGEWDCLAESGSHYTHVSLSGDGRYAAGSAKNYPLSTVWKLSPRAVAWPIDTAEGGAIQLAQLDGQWHAMTSEQHRYRWWRLHADKPPELVFDVPRPSGYQKSAMAYGSEPLAVVALDNTSTRLVDPRSGVALLDLIDGYQTDRTQDLRFDSNCRQLALALGHQGFLVWDLERLQQEFEKIGLTLDPK